MSPINGFLWVRITLLRPNIEVRTIVLSPSPFGWSCHTSIFGRSDRIINLRCILILSLTRLRFPLQLRIYSACCYLFIIHLCISTIWNLCKCKNQSNFICHIFNAFQVSVKEYVSGSRLIICVSVRLSRNGITLGLRNQLGQWQADRHI